MRLSLEAKKSSDTDNTFAPRVSTVTSMHSARDLDRMGSHTDKLVLELGIKYLELNGSSWHFGSDKFYVGRSVRLCMPHDVYTY
jgi:hypothetical protein